MLTKKWLRQVVSVIIIIFFALSSLLIAVIAKSYYDRVDTILSSNCNDVVTSFFRLSGVDTKEDFLAGGRSYIENFSLNDKIEVWIIDNTGNVVLSSSGFKVNDTVLPDYSGALKSANHRGEWRGRNSLGEYIMSETMLILKSDGSTAGAVRFIVSVEDVLRQLIVVACIVFVACIVCLLLIFFISTRFLFSKIIKPVQSVSDTAHKIANGDFDARIQAKNKKPDEIDFLCNSVNDMALELSNADKMKNDFISTVSHELRTPLTAIKGWGETIMQIGDTDPSMTKRGMEVIVDESARLDHMVEELLDFSRMNTGGLVLNTDRIDILAELDECIFTYREKAKKDGIDFYYNVPQIPVPAVGDADRIRQVFINLIDNAIKYNQQGGKVTVTAEIKRPSSLIITFADSGRGISSEDIPRVKEKFYKADKTVRGSGIGLAVADEIVRLHNGELLIDSVLGEGTAVTVILPVDEIPEGADYTDSVEGETLKDE